MKHIADSMDELITQLRPPAPVLEKVAKRHAPAWVDDDALACTFCDGRGVRTYYDGSEKWVDDCGACDGTGDSHA